MRRTITLMAAVCVLATAACSKTESKKSETKPAEGKPRKTGPVKTQPRPKGHPVLPIFHKVTAEVCACKDLACAKKAGMAGGRAMKKHRSYIGTAEEEAELRTLLKKFKACIQKLKEKKQAGP